MSNFASWNYIFLIQVQNVIVPSNLLHSGQNITIFLKLQHHHFRTIFEEIGHSEVGLREHEVGREEGGTKHVIACTPAPCILNVNFCPYPYKHQFGFGILNMVGPKKQDQKSTISKETIVFAGDSLSKSSNHTFKVNFLCQKSTDSKTFFFTYFNFWTDLFSKLMLNFWQTDTHCNNKIWFVAGVRSCDSSSFRRCTPILNWSE